jgi:uncharacterized protein
MAFVFIGTTGDQAGQSLVTWALARRLSEKGLSIGFFKPRGTTPICQNGFYIDSDALLFKEVFDLPAPLEKICPGIFSEQAMSPGDNQRQVEEIKALALEAAAGKDALLVIGSKHLFFDDAPHALPDALLISELQADLVLIHHFKKISTTIYSLLSIISLLRERVKSVIINRVPAENIPDLKNQIIPILSQKGVPSVVVLPEDPVFSFRNVGRIKEILEGQIICGEALLGRTVVGMTVGTGALSGGLHIFKRVYNKIILLGPGNDGQEVVGIILTGNRRPADQVLEAAQKSGIPLILVKEDSFGVKERLEHSTPFLTPADETKMLHFTAMLDRDDALNGIVRSLGLDGA